jgi:F-type H+-transporting ATPase subunit b
LTILPETNQLIYSTVAFFILLFLLTRFAFPPILSILDKRAETIRESIERAEETRQEAEKLLSEYKTQLSKARSEAQQIIEQGRILGENMKKDLVEKANREARGMIERAQTEISLEKEKALSELRNKVADLSIGLASRVLQKSLEPEDHVRLIEDYLASVGEIHES